MPVALHIFRCFCVLGLLVLADPIESLVSRGILGSLSHIISQHLKLSSLWPSVSWPMFVFSNKQVPIKDIDMNWHRGISSHFLLKAIRFAFNLTCTERVKILKWA